MPFLRMTPAPGDEHSGLPSSSYQFATHNFIFGDLTNESVGNLRILNIRQGDSRFVGFDARGGGRSTVASISPA